MTRSTRTGSTHTYALLEVSSETFLEIRRLLTAAGYRWAFDRVEGRQVIDMHGLALVERAQAHEARAHEARAHDEAPRPRRRISQIDLLNRAAVEGIKAGIDAAGGIVAASCARDADGTPSVLLPPDVEEGVRLDLSTREFLQEYAGVPAEKEVIEVTGEVVEDEPPEEAGP